MLSTAPRRTVAPMPPTATSALARRLLLVLGLGAPGIVRAQGACPAPVTASVARGLIVPTVASVGMVVAQRQSDQASGDWRLASGESVRAVAATPSSSLHALGSYHQTRLAMQALAGACAPSTRDVMLAVLYAEAMGVAKEVADGWYTGFSRADLVVNSVGIAYAAAQARIPVLRHLTPTASMAPRALRQGTSAVTDWSAQTYWMSADVEALLPGAAAQWWPSAVRLSAGRRVAGAERAVVVGLDLDAARLPGSHPAWRRVKGALHHVRLPAPAVVMSSNGTRTVGLYW